MPDRTKSSPAEKAREEQPAESRPAPCARQFLVWVLGVALLWETIARPVIITCWPQIILPPSLLREICGLLMGIAGGL